MHVAFRQLLTSQFKSSALVRVMNSASAVQTLLLKASEQDWPMAIRNLEELLFSWSRWHWMKEPPCLNALPWGLHSRIPTCEEKLHSCLMGWASELFDRLAWPTGLPPPSSHHALSSHKPPWWSICEGTMCLLPSSRTLLSLAVALRAAGPQSVVEPSPAGPEWLSRVVAVPVSSWPAVRHAPTTWMSSKPFGAARWYSEPSASLLEVINVCFGGSSQAWRKENVFLLTSFPEIHAASSIIGYYF